MESALHIIFCSVLRIIRLRILLCCVVCALAGLVASLHKHGRNIDLAALGALLKP